MKQKWLVVILVVILSFVFTSNALARKKQEKTGYIDLKKVFDGYGKTKAFDKEMLEIGKKKEQTRRVFTQKIEELRVKLDKTKNKNKKEEIQKKLNTRQKELNEYTKNAKDELKKIRDAKVRSILEDINRVVKAHSDRHGFSVIIDKRSVVYGQESAEISDEILKELNR